MAKKAKELGYPAIALTDHGNIDGWWDFYQACKANGIQPILSCEFYVAKNFSDTEDHPWKKNGEQRVKRGHLIIHAKGQEGIDALRELYNESWNEFKEKGNKNVIFEKDIFAKAGKILVQSACTGSYFDTEDKLLRFKEVFGDDLYLEIQPHILDQDYNMEARKFLPVDDKQDIHNVKIINWARKHDINLIVTGDSHYTVKEDKIIQDIQILNSYVGVNTGWHFPHDTNHLMDRKMWWDYFTREQTETRKIFTEEDFDKCLETMAGIIEKTKGCTLEKDPSLREFPLESHELYQEGDTKDVLLMRIINDIGKMKDKPDVYKKRLARELKLIREQNFVDYFLIYEDIIRWNRNNGYLTGPGRGSAAGSLLAYCLDITKRDPIKQGLLFERFMDPNRSDYPDIDSDFEEQKLTMEYCAEKYGRENVINIGAYQTIKVKTALKNAYKTLSEKKGWEYDYVSVNTVTKNIPETNARGEDSQVEIFLELLKESKEEMDKCERRGTEVPRSNLYNFLKDKPGLAKAVHKMLGKVTNLRVHPCSIIITDKPVREKLPVAQAMGGVVTAFDGPGVEGSGEVKMDILGLKTLNYIGEAIRFIRARHGIDLFDKIWDLDVSDPKVLAAMDAADTKMVFQFNTAALQNIIRLIGVKDFNDLVAIVALVRPGPLKAGFHYIYKFRKEGELGLNELYYYWDEETCTEKVADAEVFQKLTSREDREMELIKKEAIYAHPKMDEVLKDTYNVITYQEQVMRMFVEIGGFTLAETNPIRKAISKGKKKLLDQAKPKFEKYAMSDAIGWTQEQVDAFFADIMGFGAYCFNLSHSDCYAYIGYICQYLKVYYPVEWWAGCLKHAGEKSVKSIMDTIDKEVEGVNVVGIDINLSDRDFTLKDNNIAMPFKFIRGMGDAVIDAVREHRPFTDLEDFVKRCKTRNAEGKQRAVGVNSIKNLIIMNAFSELEPEFNEQALLEHFLENIRKEKNIKEEDQQTIDDRSAFMRRKAKIDPLYQNDWLEDFPTFFGRSTLGVTELLEDYGKGAKVAIGGEIIDARKKLTKKGDPYWEFNMMQKTDKIKVRVFKNILNQENIAPIFEDPTAINGKVLEIYGEMGEFMGYKNFVAYTVKEVKFA